MTRYALPAAVLFLAISVSAFGQIADPTGFCPTTASDCFTGNGIGGETIGVGATSFVMEKNGNSSPSASPWHLILALPNYSGAAPTLTTSDFALSFVVNIPSPYLSSSPDLYTFTGTGGPSSMNAPNMFGANEVAAFGSIPSFFDVFVYTYTPAYVGGMTPYSFSVGGSGLPKGTFLAASAGNGTGGFSTPFTTTGLVNVPGGGTVPEPSSIILLGTVSLGICTVIRKKAQKRA